MLSEWIRNGKCRGPRLAARVPSSPMSTPQRQVPAVQDADTPYPLPREVAARIGAEWIGVERIGVDR